MKMSILTSTDDKEFTDWFLEIFVFMVNSATFYFSTFACGKTGGDISDIKEGTGQVISVEIYGKQKRKASSWSACSTNLCWETQSTAHPKIHNCCQGSARQANGIWYPTGPFLAKLSLRVQRRAKHSGNPVLYEWSSCKLLWSITLVVAWILFSVKGRKTA